jgi:hypothetical protein
MASCTESLAKKLPAQNVQALRYTEGKKPHRGKGGAEE